MNLNFFKLRNIILLLPLLCSTFHALGQKKGFDNLSWFDDRKLHFGFYLGLNTMDYRLSSFKSVYDNPVVQQQMVSNPAFSPAQLQQIYKGKSTFGAEVYQIMPGFTVGGVINLRLGRDFDLRFTPGMSLGSRHFTYIPVKDFIDPSVYNSTGQNESTYLSTASYYVDLPLGIRYKGFRHRNLRPYIYSGFAYRPDLANKKISESVVHLKKNGGYAEIGFGLDSYLEYFRFTAEFRFSYGLNNLIRHDVTDPIPYYGYIFKELYSNIFTLILYFE